MAATLCPSSPVLSSATAAGGGRAVVSGSACRLTSWLALSPHGQTSLRGRSAFQHGQPTEERPFHMAAIAAAAPASASPMDVAGVPAAEATAAAGAAATAEALEAAASTAVGERGHKASTRPLLSLTPPAEPVSMRELEQLHDFVERSKRLLVVTGAGVSTESGIPDYRSPNGAYSKGYKPMTHQQFLRSDDARLRYWARSYVGWHRFSSAAPGPSHRALAVLERNGRLDGGVITQNVDRLHQKAGNSNVLELHGTTHEVVCLNCGQLSCRHDFQHEITQMNPEWAAVVQHMDVAFPRKGAEAMAAPGTVSDASFGMQRRPDGDVEVGEAFWRQHGFRVPDCRHCGGTLKPDVIFFGDNVPKQKVELTRRMVEASDAILVVGSSLMVLSAFRIITQAAERGSPVAILTIGPTRADHLASLKIEARSGEVLLRLLSLGALSVPRIA